MMIYGDLLDRSHSEKYDLYNKLYLRNMDMKEKKIPNGKYAWTATVGEKGQIVIPKQAREIFNIKPGDTLILLGDEQLGIAIPPKEEFELLGQRIFGGK